MVKTDDESGELLKVISAPLYQHGRRAAPSVSFSLSAVRRRRTTVNCVVR